MQRTRRWVISGMKTPGGEVASQRRGHFERHVVVVIVVARKKGEGVV